PLKRWNVKASGRKTQLSAPKLGKLTLGKTGIDKVFELANHDKALGTGEEDLQYEKKVIGQ
ncbi:MAG: hypothetical protein Q9214_008053, partial [Letrouitia sp. 1 TL-2023]